jgi:hypothetical protein
MTILAKEFADKLSMASLQDMVRAGSCGNDPSFERLAREALEIKQGVRRVEQAAESGRLIAIEEPPSKQNGGRYGVTRFEGDIMEWMRPFMSVGSVGRINYELAQKGAGARSEASGPRSER